MTRVMVISRVSSNCLTGDLEGSRIFIIFKVKLVSCSPCPVNVVRSLLLKRSLVSGVLGSNGEIVPESVKQSQAERVGHSGKGWARIDTFPVSAGGWVHVRGNLLERLVGGVLGSS